MNVSEEVCIKNNYFFTRNQMQQAATCSERCSKKNKNYYFILFYKGLYGRMMFKKDNYFLC